VTDIQTFARQVVNEEFQTGHERARLANLQVVKSNLIHYLGDGLSSFAILGCQLSVHSYQQCLHLRLLLSPTYAITSLALELHLGHLA
jgi:hypothetical protein